MSEKSNKVSKKHKSSKNVVAHYVLTSILFVAIALVVIIPIIIVGMTPATTLAHKVENALSVQARDIELDSNLADFESGNYQYGSKIATVQCASKGISCDVYAGLNRVSTRYGVAYATTSSTFADKGNSIIAGYDESYFSALKLVEKGDTINVVTANIIYEYQVTDTFIDTSNSSKIEDSNKNQLVLYSLFSDFSNNSGKSFYVVAKYVGEGVVE